MTNKELVLDALRRIGKATAEALQDRSAVMTGTELYAEEDYIPDFRAACEQMNMLDRHAGMTDGFVCRSTAGRVVRLLQNYDSTVYTGEPEELPAQWGFVWSADPAKALPFVAMSTSPYMTGDCCTEGGQVYRSTIDNNVWAPSAYPTGWADLGAIGAVEEPKPEQPEPEPEQPDPAPEPEPEEPEPTDYPDFVQPTGAHDAYNTGDIVNYNGTLYKSLIDGNVWSPEAYPQGWEVYSE